MYPGHENCPPGEAVGKLSTRDLFLFYFCDGLTLSHTQPIASLHPKNNTQRKELLKLTIIFVCDQIDSLLKKDIAKGRLTEAQAEETRSRVKTTQKMADFSDVDFVIEAVSENPVLKANLFRDLAQATPKHAILASNTSSISITKIAAAAKGREEQVIGMHFMNPVPVMKLVEIIPGLATSNEVLRTTKDLAVAMGKTCTVSQDVPGFVANRLLMPYINEAIIAYETVRLSLLLFFCIELMPNCRVIILTPFLFFYAIGIIGHCQQGGYRYHHEARN